jgi:Fibronectin type III domain
VIERAVGDGDFESDPSWTTDADTTSFTFNDLAPGTTYRFKVQAKNGPLQSDSSEVFSTKTILPPPSNVVASNLNNDTHDITVSWENGSSNYGHLILRKYALVDGVMGSTPIDTITLDGSATNYTFTNNADGETDEFTVQASRNSMDDGGGISPDDSGGGDDGGDDSSGDDTTSTPTDPVQNFTEPTDTWTGVFGPTTPSKPYVKAVWSPEETEYDDDGQPYQVVRDYSNQTVTLTLTGLPRHTYARISGGIEGDGPAIEGYGYDAASGFTFEVTVDGTPVTPDPVAIGGGADYVGFDWRFGICEGKPQDAFKHTASSMTITMKVSGLPAGSSWEPDVEVSTYMPFVSISGSGMAVEDGSGEGAKFTVTRTGDGTVLGDALTVSVVDAIDVDPNAAQSGVRYKPLGDITIPAGLNNGSKDIVPINDNPAEGVQPIYQSVAKKTTYELAAPPAVAPDTNATTAAAAIDDDVAVHEIMVSVMPPPAHIEPKENENKFNQYHFYVSIEVRGEHLDTVDVSQDILATTEIFDFNGSDMTNDEINSFLGPLIEATGQTYNPILVNSGGWQPDEKWDIHPLVPDDDTHNGYALEIDDQAFGVGAQQFGSDPDDYMSQIASTQRKLSLKFVDDLTGAQLAEHNWGYNWTNGDCAWLPGDEPVPPYVCCAVNYKHDAAGTYTGIVGIDGLN